MLADDLKQRTCTECSETLPVSEFYQTTLKATGRVQYHAACRGCYKLRMRKYDAAFKSRNNGVSRSVSARSKNLRSYATHIIHMAKTRAKKKGLDFAIDVDWLLASLDSQNWLCAISGKSMVMSAGTGKRLFNGVSIDRIDNGLGYTPENCWLVCYSINAFKGNADLKQVIDMCKAVTKKWEC